MKNNFKNSFDRKISQSSYINKGLKITKVTYYFSIKSYLSLIIKQTISLVGNSLCIFSKANFFG